MEDAAGLADLRWRWYEERNGGSGAAADEFRKWFPAWLADNITTHLPYVAVVDNQVCGAAWLALGSRVPTLGQPHRPSGDVQAVFVVQELRNHGIGAALLAAILNEARQRGLQHVTVHAARQAITFYQRLGFTADGSWLAWTPPTAGG